MRRRVARVEGKGPVSHRAGVGSSQGLGPLWKVLRQGSKVQGLRVRTGCLGQVRR